LTHLTCDLAGNPDYDAQPILPEESAARHGPFVWRRWQAWLSLNRLHVNNARLVRFANCGSGAWLERSHDGTDLRVRCNRCHDRWCPACSAERARTLLARLREKLDLTHCRFMTLTLRHSNTPLTAQIDRLYRSFALLRRRADFRAHITGGAAFFEAKISDKDGLWHPHLHVMIEGTWWAQKELVAAWYAITGDSTICDIRAIGDDDGTAKYVTKYVTKPAHDSVYRDPDRFDELVSALNGRRLCMTFGSWRGFKLNETPDDPTEWHAVAPLADLAARAKSGDADAQRFMCAAARKWPLLALAYHWPADTS